MALVELFAQTDHALTIGSVKTNSCARLSPLSELALSMLKKLRIKVRAALGSEAGRKGRRKKGMSSAVLDLQ